MGRFSTSVASFTAVVTDGVVLFTASSGCSTKTPSNQNLLPPSKPNEWTSVPLSSTLTVAATIVRDVAKERCRRHGVAGCGLSVTANVMVVEREAAEVTLPFAP
ncbi:hypothetical protein TSUD_383700 [Trifolium subterraneum]|uniref:Uncharacterized protein n=1 Tax=Trifolium subterraneum TaxID=3900 RepID=A0A2Z6MTQ5_TRISU|nr:hypothetical protein TSUD_383700 [Trifolium subterraneum]